MQVKESKAFVLEGPPKLEQAKRFLALRGVRHPGSDKYHAQHYMDKGAWEQHSRTGGSAGQVPVVSKLHLVLRNQNKKNQQKSKPVVIRVAKSGKYAVIGYSSALRGDINVADLSSGQAQKFYFNKLEGGLGGLQIMNSGQKILALDRKGKAVLLNAVERELRDSYENSFNTQVEGAKDFDFVCTEQKAVIGCEDKELVVFDLNAKAREASFQGHGSEISSVACHPFMAVALTASMDESVRLWDLNSGNNFMSITPHKTGVTRVKWHPNGYHYFSCGKDNYIHILDIRKRGVLQSAQTKSEPRCLDVSDKFFVTGDSSGAVTFFDNFCSVVDYARRDEGNGICAMEYCRASNLLVLAREKSELIEVYTPGRDGRDKIENFISKL